MVGADTVSAAVIVTVSPADHPETTVGCVTHRERARTEYVPAAVHVLACVEAPQADMSVIPSPYQSNWYSTGCPRFELEPPVV